MDIMELGAIGEFVSGIAVIGSLVYVGLQVRQSNRLNQAEALRSYTRDFNQTVMSPLQDPAFAELVGRGMNGFNNLDRGEQAALHAQWYKIVHLGQANFLLRKDRLVRSDFAASSELGDVAFLKTPGAAQWWSVIRPAFVPEYAEHLDQLVQSEPVPALTDVVPWWQLETSSRDGA